MSRILVTGGLGFIGHHVVQLLQQRGHVVRIIDNCTTYGIIPEAELNRVIAERRSVIDPSTIVHRIDVESDSVAGVHKMFLPETVIHLASFPRQLVVNQNPRAGARVMCEGLLNLLECSVEHGVEKFVYVSSSMVYGNFSDGVRENAPCKPLGQYGIMKWAGELLVGDYGRRGLNTTVIRPSAVYGERDVEDRVASKFLAAARNNDILTVRGRFEKLDFTHVSDCARGIVDAALSENTRGKTYNITRGHGVTLEEAAILACKIAGAGGITIEPADDSFPHRGALDCGAARRDFGYDPKIDLEQGFKLYYEWLQSTDLD
jgi:nucleoside-diphosphate-sugar epimerase